MLVPPKNILLMMMYQFPRPHDTLFDKPLTVNCFYEKNRNLSAVKYVHCM